MKLVVQEQETEPLKRFVFGRSIVGSEIATVEVMRAAGRRPNRTVALERASVVLARTALLRLDASTLQRAGNLHPPTLRSLDAIHLAAALSLGDELDAMVVYDHRLATAAAELGIRTRAPGAD